MQATALRFAMCRARCQHAVPPARAVANRARARLGDSGWDFGNHRRELGRAGDDEADREERGCGDVSGRGVLTNWFHEPKGAGSKAT